MKLLRWWRLRWRARTGRIVRRERGKMVETGPGTEEVDHCSWGGPEGESGESSWMCSTLEEVIDFKREDPALRASVIINPTNHRLIVREIDAKAGSKSR